MEYSTKQSEFLIQKFDKIKEIFNHHGIKLEQVRIFGYFLKDSNGATSDLDLLINLEIKDKYEIYDWQDVDRNFMEAELTNLLNINVKIHTNETLFQLFHFYDGKEKLIASIEANAKGFIEFCKN